MQTIQNTTKKIENFLKSIFHAPSEKMYKNLLVTERYSPHVISATDGQKTFEIDTDFIYGNRPVECPEVGAIIDISTFHASYRFLDALNQQGRVKIYDDDEFLESTRLKEINKVGIKPIV